MKLSNNAHKLRQVIEKAIEDHEISRDEYDMIVHHATEDGHIDPQERSLLSQLQDMIADKVVKVIP